MTKHRKPEEWTREILRAASEEIEENGFTSLSMNSIARRTELSKGGIYRFFSNKKEVALALFTNCYKEALDVDEAAALAWNLPIAETYFRLISSIHSSMSSRGSQDRVWIQLLPEIFRDEDFRRERDRLLELLVDKYVRLAYLLTARDGLSLSAESEGKIIQGIRMGAALFEGLTIQGALGASEEERDDLSRLFINVLVRDILGEILSADKSENRDDG